MVNTMHGSHESFMTHPIGPLSEFCRTFSVDLADSCRISKCVLKEWLSDVVGKKLSRL